MSTPQSNDRLVYYTLLGPDGKEGYVNDIKELCKLCNRSPKGTLAIIDKLLAQKIDILENGVSRRVTMFEAILIQIWNKELSGNKRAMDLRLKYQEHFASKDVTKPSFLIEHILPPGYRLKEANNA